MIRHTAIALATVAILAGAPAHAQQEPRREAVEIDRSALVDARLAALRAGLSLTPAQEELFAPLAETWRSIAETRAERREAMRAERRARMPERFGADDEGRGPGTMGRGMGRGTGQGMGQGTGQGTGQGIGPGAMMSDEEMRGMMGRGFGTGADDDFMVRLQRRAAVQSARADELTRLAEAMQPFWDSLDERQQALLPVLVRGTEGLAVSGRDGRRHGERAMRGRMHHGMHGQHGRGWN